MDDDGGGIRMMVMMMMMMILTMMMMIEVQIDLTCCAFLVGDIASSEWFLRLIRRVGCLYKTQN